MALADLARHHELDTPVPTCGDWTLADVVWHVTEVQNFWAYIIANRPAGPDGYPTPERPEGERLAGLLDERCHQLVELLQRADPTDRAWSWADEQTVAFTLRRQTHEALIHHVDGALAIGGDLPAVESAVAADGIDELVTVMLSGVPEWATLTADSATIQLTTHDTADNWNLRCGTMTGTSPDSGRYDDLTAYELLDQLDTPTTTVAAGSLDLLLWLWGRCSSDRLTTAGDLAGVDRLRSAVAESTQ